MSPSMVEVIAPATLQEGYTFQAVYEGTPFTVRVPYGGVKEGQKMIVPFGSTESTPLFGFVDDNPHGTWRDGLCHCCRFSCFHPSFLNAWCCPQLLMAQVATRLKLNLLANPAQGSGWKKTFKLMFLFVVVYFVLTLVFGPPEPVIEVSEDGEVTATRPEYAQWKQIIYDIIWFCFAFYTLYFLTKLRYAIREEYSISAGICGAFEDFCCVFWCGCCTLAQMARHTANYDQRRAVCCSDTGLPPSPV